MKLLNPSKCSLKRRIAQFLNSTTIFLAYLMELKEKELTHHVKEENIRNFAMRSVVKVNDFWRSLLKVHKTHVSFTNFFVS